MFDLELQPHLDANALRFVELNVRDKVQKQSKFNEQERTNRERPKSRAAARQT